MRKTSPLDRKVRKFGFDSYNDYINSDYWSNFRTSYYDSQLPQQCIACDWPQFILHHLHYTTLTRESFYDIIPICVDCHHKLHKYNRKFPRASFEPHKAFQKIYNWSDEETYKRFSYWINYLNNSRNNYIKHKNRDSLNEIDKEPRNRYHKISTDLRNFRQYIKNGYSIDDLAGMYKVSPLYIRAYLRKYPEYFE